MAYAQRPESFLPMIKCSTCGADIDMSALADHVCAGPADSSTPAYGNGFLSRLASRQGPASTAMQASSPAPRFGKSRLPPQIDAGAANRPYLEPGPATPNKYGSAYRSDMPLTPNENLPVPRMNNPLESPRSVRNAPPSPPMSLGYDNPFPPWPSSPAVESASRNKSLRERDANTPNPPRNPRLDAPPAAEQPLASPVQNLMKRMDTSARGPFDARSQATKNVAPSAQAIGSGHRRNKTSESAKSFRSRGGFEPHERPSTSHSKRSQPSVYSEISNSNPYGGLNTYGEDEPPVPEIPKLSLAEPSQVDNPVQDVDAFLEQFPDDNAASYRPPPVRSHTYPEDRQPTLPNVSLPDTSACIESSRDNPRHKKLAADAQHMPRLPGLRTQFPGIASAHSPTESASSNNSVFSSTSSHSSRSSPPDSEADPWSRRPSDASVRPEQSAGPYSRTGGMAAPRLPQVEPTPPMPHSRQRSRTLNTPAPSRRLSRDLETEAKLSSPIDPAVQHGIFGSGRRPSAPSLTRAPVDTSPQRGAGLHRYATTAQRPTCRGCTSPIIGKAIKASDGRLTGRWHKDCFVCLTCSAPFPTGDFYVLNDQPYCERHYHSLNGSLCAACDGGIEGQYLETDGDRGRGRKYHKLCFTCDACDIPLRDEYYEVGGKQYCERHAWAVAQKQAGLDPSGRGYRGGGYGAGARLEKRSTRLVMM